MKNQKETVLKSHKEGISNMEFPSLTIVGGQVRSGKSQLLKSILITYAARNFNEIRIFCPTFGFQTVYNGLPKEWVTENPCEDDIKTLIEEQKTMKYSDRKVLLCMDDILGLFDTHHGKAFTTLATQFRHYRISVIILVQDMKGISPPLRDNCSYLFVTGMAEHSLTSCYSLSRGFTSQTAFRNFMQEHSIGFHCVRFNRFTSSDGGLIVFQMSMARNNVSFRKKKNRIN